MEGRRIEGGNVDAQKGGSRFGVILGRVPDDDLERKLVFTFVKHDKVWHLA